MTSPAMRAPAPGATDDVTFDADMEVVVRPHRRRREHLPIEVFGDDDAAH